MFKRFVPLLVVVGLAAAPLTARAADTETPTLLVRVSSIDGLIADAKYLASLAGKGEQAEQVDKLVKLQIGPQGLSGIDAKRPLGMYGTISPDVVSSEAVILVPIADEKAFLDLLDRFNFPAIKGDGDIYTVRVQGSPVPFFFRFANKYAYVTGRDPGAIDRSELPDPAKLLPAGDTGALSATIRLDRIPDQLKQVALANMELRLADAQEEREPGASEAEHRLKVQILKEFARQATAVLRDGRELAVRLDLDREAGNIKVELSLDGNEDTRLAGAIADLGKARNQVAGGLNSQAAAVALMHIALPEGIREAFDQLVDDGISKALAKETNPAKKAQAEKILNALTPSLKAREIDAAFSLRGPDDNNYYTMVAGVSLKDGKELEKVLLETVEKLPAGDREQIKLADTVDGVKVHSIQVKEMDPKAEEVFGREPTLYVAIREDSAFLALGDDGLKAIKEALTGKGKAGPQLEVEMSLRRLARAMARENKRALQAALTSFSGGDDTVRLTVEGGKALKVQFTMKAQVVKFLNEMRPEQE